MKIEMGNVSLLLCGKVCHAFVVCLSACGHKCAEIVLDHLWQCAKVTEKYP